MNRLPIKVFEKKIADLILKNANVKEIFYAITQDFNSKNTVHPLTDEEIEMIDNLCNDITEEHPNYYLRQRVRKCKVLMDGQGKGTEYVLFSPASNTQWVHSKSSLERILSKSELDGKVHHCNMMWDPYDNIKMQKGKNGWWIFNTYTPPTWIGKKFFKENLTFPESKLPEIYDKFLNHLVDNDQESYEYILDWLAMALQPDKRNFCILTTIGQQGIGKGILGQIMEKLVGKENCSLTTQKAISGTFNKQLLNKIIIYINEVEVKTIHDENKLKSYIDETIEIEAKFVDAVSIKNYGNLYLSTNNEDALRLTADDRRFSIVSLTKTKLTPSYWESVSGYTIDDIFNPKFIEKLGNFLMNRVVDVKRMASPLKTQLTEEIREASLKPWEFHLIENIWYDHQGTEMPIDALSRKLEEKFGSNSRVGAPGLKKLQKIYPQKIQIIRTNRKNQKREYVIKFLKGE